MAPLRLPQVKARPAPDPITIPVSKINFVENLGTGLLQKVPQNVGNSVINYQKNNGGFQNPEGQDPQNTPGATLRSPQGPLTFLQKLEQQYGKNDKEMAAE